MVNPQSSATGPMYQRGDDVTVNFAGRDHPGEIIDHKPPWIMARIHIDPTWDYGNITARLDPTPTVCVREKNVAPIPS